jgi:hypothetical protein
MSTKLSSENVKTFALAGNAIITLQSGKTGKHFTYKITKHETTHELFFVRLLHGPDNENDYKYIGCYYSDTGIFTPCKTLKNSFIFTWPASVRAIKYFFERIDNIPKNLFVYHEGRCGRCGKKLTTPESIERGLGPECYKRSVK